MRTGVSVCALVLVSSVGIVSAQVQFDLTLQDGWNLVSIPIEPDDKSVEAVFQGANTGAVWGWDGSRYHTVTEVEAGQGYWVHYTPPARDRLTLTINGSVTRDVTKSLSQGWQLLGKAGDASDAALALPLSADPDSAMLDEAYRWDGAIYVLTQTAAAGEAVWVYVVQTCDVRTCPNPDFEGILMCYSAETGKAQVHWADAVDDHTAPDNLTYHVYRALAAERDTLIQQGNLYTSVTDQRNVVVEGLTGAAEYSFVVVAEDEDGNQNYVHRIVTLTVLDADVVTAVDPKDLITMDVLVEASARDDHTFTVTGADAGTLAVDDIIVFDNPNG